MLRDLDEQRYVYVASTDNHRDVLSKVLPLLTEKGCYAHSPSSLHHQVVPLQSKGHGLANLLLRHQHEVIHKLLNHTEGVSVLQADATRQGISETLFLLHPYR